VIFFVLGGKQPKALMELRAEAAANEAAKLYIDIDR